MHKFFIIQCLLLFISAGLHCQNIENFEIPLAESKINNSQYNTIKLLDSRSDTTTLGIVQTGLFNRKANVIPKKPLSIQLFNVFNSMINETAKSNELLLQIRQFSFAEITGSMSEKGYCFLRAELYTKKAEQYQKISSIDTVICLKSSIDVTKAIIKAGGEAIAGFIMSNLLHEPAGSAYYTYNDILGIDNFEKRKLKVYNTATYTDGLYLTYQSFRDQIPDKQITVEGNDVNNSVRTTELNGKSQKVKIGKVYAVVYNGQPYIATPFEYYPLKKVNDDFLFTGKAKVTASTGAVITASAFLGIIGGLIASDAESTFEMKLDHINGGFIRLKEIPQTGGD